MQARHPIWPLILRFLVAFFNVKFKTHYPLPLPLMIKVNPSNCIVTDIQTRNVTKIGDFIFRYYSIPSSDSCLLPEDGTE